MIIHHSSLIADRCDTTTASLPGWSVWEAALADGKQRGAPPKKAPNEVMLKWVLICRTVSHFYLSKIHLSWLLFFPLDIGCQADSAPFWTKFRSSGHRTTSSWRGLYYSRSERQHFKTPGRSGRKYKLNAIWKKEGGGVTWYFFFWFLCLFFRLFWRRLLLVADCLAKSGDEIVSTNDIKSVEVFSAPSRCVWKCFSTTFCIAHPAGSARICGSRKRGAGCLYRGRAKSWRWQLCCLTPPPLKAHKGCWLYVFHSVVLK